MNRIEKFFLFLNTIIISFLHIEVESPKSIQCMLVPVFGAILTFEVYNE